MTAPQKVGVTTKNRDIKQNAFGIPQTLEAYNLTFSQN